MQIPPSFCVMGLGGCSLVVELGWTGFSKDWGTTLPLDAQGGNPPVPPPL